MAIQSRDEAATNAGRAKFYCRYLTDTQREGSTVAVSQLDGKEIVAINASAPDGAVKAIQEAAVANQADFIAAEPGEHAEQAIFRVGQGDGNFDAIGVSNYTGPCQSCRNYFRTMDAAQRPGLYYIGQYVNFP